MKKTITIDELNDIATRVQHCFNLIQDHIARNGGVIYLIDNTHRFLGFAGWAWNLQNKAEIKELLQDFDLMNGIRGVRMSYIVDSICASLGWKKSLPVLELPAPITRQPGSTVAEYREALQQHIVNTYYPN
jgi:hypothetical protein